MKLSGIIKGIYKTQQVTDSFTKREFVVEYAENPQYPEFIKFEMIQDKCSILDQYKAGDSVTVEFNLKGRCWANPETQQNVYFNTLQCWKLNKDSQPAQQQNQSFQQPPQGNNYQNEDEQPF